MELGATRTPAPPASLVDLARAEGLPLTDGLAPTEHGVFTADGLLPRGLHVVAGADVVRHFGGTDQRDRLLQNAASGLRYMHETHGLDWVVGGGSLFTTPKAHPGDADLLAVTDGTRVDAARTKYFNRIWGSDGREPGRHPANLYPVDAPRQGFRGETMLRMFASTRDDRPTGLLAFRALDLVDAVRTLGRVAR